MIAVDATVLADFLAGEPNLKAAAEGLMREDPDWISVGLWRYELGNVLWKRVRFQDADPAEMRSCLVQGGRLVLETVDELDRSGVWHIAIATGLTFYDSSYVWLARAKGVTLRTRDKKILRECPDVARPMPDG